VRKFKQFLEDVGGGTGACAVGGGGGTMSTNIAQYARPVGAPVRRNYPDQIATVEYKPKKKKLSKI